MSIHSGAGGLESCDWSLMLFRMYSKYFLKQNLKLKLLHYSEEDSGGIKSASFLVEGEFSYGKLKGEAGVHRLVRISPFDSSKRRHTSFSSISVWPEIDLEIEVEIKPDDLRIDTYRAGGKGGQHVNKTDSAVRITHLPSKTVVQCQKERSQHANKERALKMLQSALYQKELYKQEEEKKKRNKSKKQNEWGSQIRSYILQPYQMVKDHRSLFETSKVSSILDGELDELIKHYLEWTKS